MDNDFRAKFDRLLQLADRISFNSNQQAKLLPMLEGSGVTDELKAQFAALEKETRELNAEGKELLADISQCHAEEWRAFKAAQLQKVQKLKARLDNSKSLAQSDLFYRSLCVSLSEALQCLLDYDTCEYSIWWVLSVSNSILNKNNIS